ncbi:hypothetical protein H6F75_13515 [Nodosilinea sp. FACHB-131]|uniref:hypothetical protein n=1 Tax=Cyanophyceae TaxID=3028117 RepID=UPI0016890410|nr:hypothetical protein [Nodosilinea sp. FACHB-131]MBD1874505.1 hypothetical protein [Nodosilinea sp. FACHB-131]
MPFNLSLLDLVLPYVVKGENLGANHAPFSIIRVTTFETASAAFGVVIRGQCEFNGRARIDIGQGRLDVEAEVDEAEPPFDPSRRAPIFDLKETTLDFELVVPRVGSAIIAAGVDTISADGFDATQAVLDVWDVLPLETPLSDFPSSGFRLDLILNAPSVRPPFLHPAQMLPNGLLVPDPAYQEVSIRLPRLRFRFAQGNSVGSTLSFELISAGVSGLDDPGDIAVAELVSMEPPYAFVGGPRDRTVGFAFRKAVLDLADGYTPPAVTAKFGFGDDWGGLYLPEVRFFLAPEGAKDFAFEAGVEDLLIGFGDDAGVSGDFDLALINQGSGELKLSARFFDADGKVYSLELTGDTTATARLPELTRMVVDIEGGRVPYATTVRIDGGSPIQDQPLVDIDLSGAASRQIEIEVVDSSYQTPIAASLTITAQRRIAQASLPTPGVFPAPVFPATLTPDPANPIRVVMASQTDQAVILTTDPPDATLRWSLDGDSPGSPRTSFLVPVGPGVSRTVQVRRPGSMVPDEVDFHFFYEEPRDVDQSDEARLLLEYGKASRASGRNVSTAKAASNLPSANREGLDQNPLVAYDASFQLVPPLSTLQIVGEASYEDIDSKDVYNYLLARRRAITVRELLRERYPDKNFDLVIDPEPRNPAAYNGFRGNFTDWKDNWSKHGALKQRDWWKATVVLPPGLNQQEQQAEVTVQRPAAPPPPDPIIPVVDPPPVNPPQPPGWFRSARLKVRIVRDVLIAGELEGEVDLQTFAEDHLQASGQPGGESAPEVRTLEAGTPVPEGNPADGITKIRLLAQADQATGRVTTLITLGADPADKDGLAVAGWLPGEDPEDKNLGLTLLGSYLSFWPLLVAATESNQGRVADWALTGTTLAIPGAIAALPWFQIERVIWYGGEFLQRDRNGELEAFLLADLRMDCSVNIGIGSNSSLIRIPQEKPLKIRYKAIGLRFGSREDGSEQFSLRPVFDSSRGYDIDLMDGSALEVAEPFGNILRVLGARLSRTNPLTFEVDLGLAIDLGVVTFDRARVRVYLPSSPGEDLRAPELTALGASVDIPGALAGQGYLEINDGGIAGQIDLTIRPVNLRVAAAIAIQQIPAAAGGPATAVYVSLNVVLPVGIPLGSSGLGIFGFRGIFGMHYQRNLAIGAGSSAPALVWLVESDGQPQELFAPSGTPLWVAQINQWAFGIGILIGTMEGGVIMNLDGTFLLELPGPRVVIILNARILSPPPALDDMGGAGGILAIIEITPEHFLIGILATYEIPQLLTVKIPVEAVFPFGTPSNWHIYLGQRSDYGEPIEVNVLGLVRGTGYLMLRGNGLNAFDAKGLPEIEGFAIGIGAAAAYVWGNVDAGLYLRVGGSLDAVVGFDPFILGGTFELSGELRLFIISIGASASLTVIVRQTSEDSTDLQTYIKGEACGHIDFFFFEVEGCVSIEIGSEEPALPPPALVKKLSLKSRTPALVQGTAVDRPVDGSLGDGLESNNAPTGNALNNLVTVPIDAIPILSMIMPPVATGLTFLGETVPDLSGVPADGFIPRGEERYRYDLTAVTLERMEELGGDVIGSGTPARWWTLRNTTEPNETAQLALLTWEPTPATKAIEKSEVLKESIEHHWGTACQNAAPPTPVLWTFLYEPLGPSPVGWELEGIALPDPPDTRRSTDPDTTLHVTERWRSGNPQIDNWRGIPPAVVIGALVPCKPNLTPEPSTPPPMIPSVIGIPDLVVGGRGPIGLTPGPIPGSRVDRADPVFTRLVPDNQVTPFRITPRLHEKVAKTQPMTAEPLDLTQLDRLRARGQSLSRAALVQATQTFPTPTARAVGVTQPQCDVRILAAPVFDDGRPVVFGDQSRSQEIAEALEAAGVTHGPLNNVVRLHTGPFQETTLLLLVQRVFLVQKRFIVRTADAEGHELTRVVPTPSDWINVKPLPALWTDPSSPWSNSIAHLQTYLSTLPGLAIVVSINGAGADHIELGLLPRDQTAKEPFAPPYYVAAIESLRRSEVERHDWDNSQISQEREVITSILGPDSTTNALLHPSSLYRVSATWTGQRASGGEESDTQHFWFRTDAEAPRRLDPWMLLTLPNDGEPFVFGAEPLRLVFNTHDVDRIYAAYGKALRIRLQAASAHHPQPQPTVPHPFPINPLTLQPIAAAILSPWEELLEEVVKETGPCIPIDENRTRHSSVTVPIPLDPYTGYILDVEMVDTGAPEDEAGVSVYRRHFSTGAYATLEEFAASLRAVKDSGRAVAPGSMAAILGYFGGRHPQGPELDEQLRSHGLEAMPAPTRPRIITFWEQVGNNPPQPTAVLVDAAEPLWRTRLYPAQVVDDTSLITSERWQYEPQEWLQLEATSGSLVPAGMIRAPGLQRALVVLPPNSRSQRLRLDLVTPEFPEPYLDLPERRHTVVDITFVKAPWEE